MVIFLFSGHPIHNIILHKLSRASRDYFHWFIIRLISLTIKIKSKSEKSDRQIFCPINKFGHLQISIVPRHVYIQTSTEQCQVSKLKSISSSAAMVIAQVLLQWSFFTLEWISHKYAYWLRKGTFGTKEEHFDFWIYLPRVDSFKYNQNWSMGESTALTSVIVLCCAAAVRHTELLPLANSGNPSSCIYIIVLHRR